MGYLLIHPTVGIQYPLSYRCIRLISHFVQSFGTPKQFQGELQSSFVDIFSTPQRLRVNILGTIEDLPHYENVFTLSSHL